VRRLAHRGLHRRKLAVEVGDEHGELFAGIQPPQLGAVHGVVRREKHVAAHRGRVADDTAAPDGAARCARIEVADAMRACRGAIRHPRLVARRIGGPEEDSIARPDHAVDVRGARARGDVGDNPRSGGGAVRAPQLLAVQAIVGGEHHDAAADRDRGCVSAMVLNARADVRDDSRAGIRAVTAPKLAAIHAVIGIEVSDSVHHGEVADFRTRFSSVDVAQQMRAGHGPVADPEFLAMHVVVGDEQIASGERGRP
jgi:hypothetical protein